MKLLNPRTIQSNINAQRKVDIDQGLILARKVDTLRDQISQEEAKLALFKDKTIKEVQNQIDEKIAERDALTTELTALKKVHDHLSRLLDKEWGEVDIEKEQLAFLQKRLDELEKEAQAKIKETEVRLKEISIEEQRQRENKKQIQQQGDESVRLLFEAKERLEDATAEWKRINKEIETKNKELAERETVLRVTIKSITMRETQLEADRKALDVDRVQVADMRATLERALNRIK